MPQTCLRATCRTLRSPPRPHATGAHCRLVSSGSCLGRLLSMLCCWSLSPPVRKGFLKAAGE